MLFNSIDFILFSIIFFSLWPFIRPHSNSRYIFITVASFIFYGWWDYRYLSLLLISGLIDYFAALGIAHFKRKKLFMGLSLLGNLGILFSFKYSLWLFSNVDSLINYLTGHNLGLANNIPDFMLILPVGISFYTFQSLSYTIDAYQGKLKPTKNIFLFFSFLSMFPQLVAGPIVRAKDILDQLREPKKTDMDAFFNGLLKIIRGYVKKTVIADTLAPFVNSAFSSPDENGMIFWWLASLCFAAQIYCDFSGYSDIAMGLANWMGLSFKKNFDHPYISSSFQEFWNRWHISLSHWFRDYVYIPLGGSKISPARTTINLWITMLISGLWHGAAANFVAWGALHATFSTLEKKLPRVNEKNKFILTLRTLFTFVMVLISWVFFRSSNIKDAFKILGKMLDPTTINMPFTISFSNTCALALIMLFSRELYYFAYSKLNISFRLFYHPTFEAAGHALLLTLLLFYRGVGNAFIYFQF